MLILLLVISIVFAVISFKKEDFVRENGYAFTFVVSSIAVLALSILIIINASCVVDSMVMDEKIGMYQEENESIESDISIMVSEYKQHELNVFDRSETTSPIVLMQMYPELKSDTLVQGQMAVYIENNKKIKELKEQKINYEINKWWLYFNL